MGGRGRGRGQAVSFNIEQLGFGRGEAIPVSVTQPPPLFPPLENQPLPLVKDTEYEYILVTQKDLNTRMMTSPFYLKSNQQCNEQRELPVFWNCMPAELRKPVAVKRALSSKDGPRARKGKRADDPDKIFAKLEAKEKTEGDEEDEDREGDVDKDQSDEERLEIDEDAENEVDEEMDEGTDYAREYFDNGENYLDEEEGDDGEAVF